MCNAIGDCSSGVANAGAETRAFVLGARVGGGQADPFVGEDADLGGADVAVDVDLVGGGFAMVCRGAFFGRHREIVAAIQWEVQC